MRRERLKVQTGCLTCRRRRKKCDEGEPRCAACVRLGLHCIWKTSSPPSPDTGSLVASATHDDASEPPKQEMTASHSSNDSRHLRIADYTSPSTNLIATDAFQGIVKVLSRSAFDLEGLISANKAEMQHNVANLVLNGWESCHETMESDHDWERQSFVDKLLALCGHGPAARLANVYLGRLMSEYLRSQVQTKPHLHTALPNWLVQSKDDAYLGQDGISLYLPWPGFKRKLAMNTRKYFSDTFFGSLCAEGARFIWPYPPHDAVELDTENNKLRLSSEFLLRVHSLRSFALTKDFLDLYPEFRGDAPQLEPSATMYQPQEEAYVEALYWQKLRDKNNQDRLSPLNLAQDNQLIINEPELGGTVSIRSSSTGKETQKEEVVKKAEDRIAVENLLN